MNSEYTIGIGIYVSIDKRPNQFVAILLSSVGCSFAYLWRNFYDKIASLTDVIILHLYWLIIQVKNNK